MFVLLFNERSVFTFRDHSLYFWENTDQDFMREGFKHKYFKADRLDDGIGTMILPRSFNCNFLGGEKEDLTLTQTLNQGS